MSQVGRISGPLLTANLERNGINLAFRNTSSDTQLLFLDVNNGKIGVNKGVAGYELDVNSNIRTTNLITTDVSSIADFTVATNNLNVLVGDINLVASEAIKLSALGTDNINIDDNIISSFNSNSNIDLIPNGTGIVDVFSNLEVYGNLHSNQNITLDGTITFGDTISQDTIEFNTEVNSDINPNTNHAHQLGSIDKRWNALYTNLVNGTSVSANSLTISGLDYNLKLGNIFYVSVNGDDTNSGDSVFSPFATVKRALAAADASTAGPVTIQIYPGEYQEQLPLTVPSNVTVQGVDMRNTIIVPDTGSQSEDVFLLNGESTVQHLTIKDFYAPGYAFRFAPNTVVSTRSPYVQNVTVITKGTTTSVSDPRGFASRDAGGGAYIDGAAVESVSQEASMLFHSVTFITPGVDAITATNGVRIEWLNGFTYFASRGLYAVDGVDGHLSTDGSTVKYGAAIRSIGSANIYGEYGAVADGADTLIYLINHNMAYIGTGKYVDNDASRVIQTQEVTELNSGRIYYQTIDQYGNYRVGDQFFVNQESGETSLVINEAQVDALNGLTITTNGNVTLINGTQVETGNIRLDNNDISSILADINISAASGIINLNSSTIVHKNLDITGDLSFGGNLNLLGNQTTDIIDFNVNFDQNINPNQDGTFNLGSAAKEWVYTNTNRANLGDIEFTENYITTTISNADLELRASGTGEVLISGNNVQINNELTVSNDTNLQDTTITGAITHVGNEIQTGNYTIAGTITNSDIQVAGNVIETTISNSDLELRANGTGTILVPNNNVQLNNDLAVGGTTNLVDLFTNSFVISNNLNISQDFNTTNLTVENLTVGSQAQFEEINIDGNVITTTTSNTNLELRASGTGIILVPNQDVVVDNNIDIQGNVYTSDMLVVQQVKAVTFETGTINVGTNIITTDVSNADLELRANGTGVIVIPNNNLQIDNNLIVDNTSNLQNVNISGLVTSAGNLNQTGNYTITNDLIISQDLNVNAATQFEEINIANNVITTTTSNTDLELLASGTGTVLIPNNNTRISNDLTVDTLNAATININNTFAIENLNSSSDIEIFDNVIRTTNSNSNLELRAAGTGSVFLQQTYFNTATIGTVSTDLNFDVTENLNIIGTGALRLPNGTTAQRVITSDIFIDGGDALIVGLTLDGGNALTVFGSGDTIYNFGAASLSSSGNLGDIRFNTSTNLFEGTSSDTVAFGGVYSTNRLTSLTAHPTNNTLVFRVNNVQVGTVNSAGIELNGLDVDDILVNASTIATNVTNSDLEFSADGLGNILIGDFEFDTNIITNTNVSDANFKFNGTNTHVVIFAGNHAVKFPAGTTAQRPVSPQLGLTRQNTDLGILETWDGDQWIPSAGLTENVSEAEMQDISLAQVLIYG